MSYDLSDSYPKYETVDGKTVQIVGPDESGNYDIEIVEDGEVVEYLTNRSQHGVDFLILGRRWKRKT